jgi:hypothetical protein
MKWTLRTISFATTKHETLFRTRTLILSSEQKFCRQKNLCLRYKRKLFKKNSNQNRSWSKSSTRNLRKRFVSLSKKQKILFRKKRLKKSLIKISISWTFRSNFASFWKSCNNLINSRKRKRFKLLRQSLKRRNSSVIQKKENEKWKMTFYISKKNIIFSRIFYEKNCSNKITMILMRNISNMKKFLSYFEKNIDDRTCRKTLKNTLSRARNVRWQNRLNINFMNYFNHYRFSWSSKKIEQWISLLIYRSANVTNRFMTLYW